MREIVPLIEVLETESGDVHRLCAVCDEGVDDGGRVIAPLPLQRQQFPLREIYHQLYLPLATIYPLQ